MMRPAASAPAAHRAYSPACPCVYVANFSGGSSGQGIVTIYPISANGNYSPGTNVINGAATGLGNPDDIGVDASGKIYVANFGNSSITTYAAGSSGNATPLQTIAGTNTGLNGPAGITTDTAGNIYAANGTSASITVFAPSANGNAAPIRTIAGGNTGLSNPKGVTVAAGKLYVANVGNSSVTVYNATANGNVTPLQVLSGANTGIAGGATDVAWRANLIYVTSGNNQVGIFPATANGNVAPTKQISGTNTLLSNPLSVAVRTFGRIYVANATFATVPPSVTAYRRYAVLGAGNNNVVPIRNITGSATDLAFPSGLSIR
jgi:6-phosphogluconolactonase (cycloisomerase 2 family)